MTKMLLGTLALMPLLASAATPSCDCTKAHSAAEQLVCQDAGLAALDNELAALYPKAGSKFSRLENRGMENLGIDSSGRDLPLKYCSGRVL